MEDDFPNNLKRELDEVFGIPTREVVESIGHSSRYNTSVSLGDFMDISYVSNLVGVSGGWVHPLLIPKEVPPNPLYMELFQ